MIAQGLSPALWSVYLGSVKDVNDPDHGNSFYTFGGYDESIVKASKQEIQWTEVDSTEGFWMFGSESASVNGKSVQLSGNRAMADTGTTLMLVSDEFCEAVYGAIPGAKLDNNVGGWVIPADNVASRPEVKVAVGDHMLTIEKEQLGWAEVDETGKTVFGAIQSRGNNTFDILGDTFLICCYAVSNDYSNILTDANFNRSSMSVTRNLASSNVLILLPLPSQKLDLRYNEEEESVNVIKYGGTCFLLHYLYW